VLHQSVGSNPTLRRPGRVTSSAGPASSHCRHLEPRQRVVGHRRRVRPHRMRAAGYEHDKAPWCLTDLDQMEGRYPRGDVAILRPVISPGRASGSAGPELGLVADGGSPGGEGGFGGAR
jgi:hypothetical protein